MSTNTKQLIADAAMALLVEKRVKKLTVKDIVEECHITRQTFYYHFEDIPHLFQWITESEFGKWKEKILTQDSLEDSIRYFLLVAINVRPYVQKTIRSSYGDEIRSLLRETLYRLMEQTAGEVRLYQGFTEEEIRLTVRYHAGAILALVENWTDEDTANLDQIVHVIACILEGKLVPEFSGVPAGRRSENSCSPTDTVSGQAFETRSPADAVSGQAFETRSPADGVSGQAFETRK